MWTYVLQHVWIIIYSSSVSITSPETLVIRKFTRNQTSILSTWWAYLQFSGGFSYGMLMSRIPQFLPSFLFNSLSQCSRIEFKTIFNTNVEILCRVVPFIRNLVMQAKIVNKTYGHKIYYMQHYTGTTYVCFF